VPVTVTCSRGQGGPGNCAATGLIATFVMVGIGCDVTFKPAGVLVDCCGPGLLTVSEPTPWLCRSAALSCTCSVAPLTKLVARGAPFQRTTEFVSNPVPVNVTVAATPGGTLRGEIVPITGTGLFMSYVTAADVPPPGAGFATVTMSSELPRIELAGNDVVNSPVLTKDVERFIPFQVTLEDGTNPVPFTSSGVAPAPATALVGVIVTIAGSGLFTWTVTAPDVPPPGAGLATVTAADPPFSNEAAGTTAVRLPDDSYAVATFCPFHCTEELVTKPVPLKAIVVSAAPASTVAGVTEVIEGVGFELPGEGF
jgi:hypothetical protein